MTSSKPRLMDPETAVKTNSLSRKFGDLHAVKSLDITIERGDICGFIGPNGAGKTTTLKMLSTLLKPSSGSAKVFGYNVEANPAEVRRLVGYMPDQFGLYRDMVAGEYLDFFAAAYGLASAERRTIIGDVLELTDLKDKKEVPITALSRGMQQRLSLARVLVHDPELLLLDEPASGLDPRARIEIRALLTELSNMEKTIFISSHILTELAQMCNKVVIIEQGDVLFAGTVEALYEKLAPQIVVQIQVKENADRAEEVLKQTAQVESTERDEDSFTVTLVADEEDAAFLATRLIEAGIPLLSFTPEKVHLEDAFMRITEGKVS
ncbi:MAG: ABC transporter ATP-binding protein [Planctomycetota bacterium]|nr:ABC transporter ATP-binding protein [Planctomycetota bacterium]